MASTFRKYRQGLVPTTHQRPTGQALQGLLGDVEDQLLDRVKQSVKARFPLLAPTDSLLALGVERQLPRGPSETDAAYAARIQNAWSTWPFAGTPFGVLSALFTLGYTNVYLETCTGRQYTLPVNALASMGNTALAAGQWFIDSARATNWSRFDVVFPTPLPTSWAGGASVPAYSSDEAKRIRAAINQWKPAFALCNRVVIVTTGGASVASVTTDGGVWGMFDGTWGDGTRPYGSSAVTIWSPV